jgi:hypothetical protein
METTMLRHTLLAAVLLGAIAGHVSPALAQSDGALEAAHSYMRGRGYVYLDRRDTLGTARRLAPATQWLSMPVGRIGVVVISPAKCDLAVNYQDVGPTAGRRQDVQKVGGFWPAEIERHGAHESIALLLQTSAQACPFKVLYYQRRGTEEPRSEMAAPIPAAVADAG